MSLRLEEVTFRYPRAPSPALQGITLEIPEGGVVAVVGPSGSGKSTLLFLLGLLCDHQRGSGEIYYHNHVYSKLGRAARARLRLHEFGFVLQSPFLLSQLTCAQNVGLPLALQGWPSARRRGQVDRLLGLVDLDRSFAEVGDRRVDEISGGQAQRLAVLRALVHDPRVIFADEPVSHLDAGAARLVLELLRNWCSGHLGLGPADARRTLVLVSHDLSSVYEQADHFILLKHGRLVGDRALSRNDLADGAESLSRLLDVTDDRR